MGIAWVFTFLDARLLGRKLLADFEPTSAGTTSLELWGVGRRYLAADSVVSVALIFNALKLMKYLRFVPVMGPSMITLINTLFHPRVLTFFLFVVFFVACVSLGAFLRFGAQAVEFSSLGRSVFAVFSMVLGQDYLEAMLGGGAESVLRRGDKKEENYSALAFYVVITFTIAGILSNTFIGLIGNVYDEVDSALPNPTHLSPDCSSSVH